MSENNKSWLTPIVHFATHTFVGTAIFFIIGVPAIGLSCLVVLLKAWNVPEFTLSVLTFLEHVILVIDATLFVVYLIFTAWTAFKEMLK